MGSFSRILLAAAVAALSTLAAPAHAWRADSAPEFRALLAQGRAAISLDDAVARVRRSTEGRVIRAETRRSNGGATHVIKILTEDGRVRTFRVEAGAGKRR